MNHSRLHKVRTKRRIRRLVWYFALFAMFAIVDAIYGWPLWNPPATTFIDPRGPIYAQDFVSPQPWSYNTYPTSTPTPTPTAVRQSKAKTLVAQKKIERRRELPTLSGDAVRDLIVNTFEVHAAEALTVAKCESGYRPVCNDGLNTNGSVDCGIFQINLSAHDKSREEMLDPVQNITYAKKLFDRQGWQPWYSSNRCHKMLD